MPPMVKEPHLDEFRGARYKTPEEFKDYKRAIGSRDPEELDNLSYTDSGLVKVRIAWNRHTRDDTRERLTKDPDLSVVIAAREAHKFVVLDREKRE